MHAAYTHSLHRNIYPFLFSSLASFTKEPGYRAQALTPLSLTSGPTPNMEPQNHLEKGMICWPRSPGLPEPQFLGYPIRGHRRTFPPSFQCLVLVCGLPTPVCEPPSQGYPGVEWSSLGFGQIKNKTCTQSRDLRVPLRTQHHSLHGFWPLGSSRP